MFKCPIFGREIQGCCDPCLRHSIFPCDQRGAGQPRDVCVRMQSLTESSSKDPGGSRRSRDRVKHEQSRRVRGTIPHAASLALITFGAHIFHMHKDEVLYEPAEIA